MINSCKIKSFDIHPNWKSMKDSMCFESGTNVFECVIEIDSKTFYFNLGVCGNVKVIYDENTYVGIHQFPNELLDLFKNNTAYNHDLVDIIESNWWSLYSSIEENGLTLSTDRIALDIDPCDFESEDAIKNYLLDYTTQIVCNMK